MLVREIEQRQTIFMGIHSPSRIVGDKNNDGSLTLKEFIGNPEGRNVPALNKQFTRRDANADGKLTLEELK